MWRRNSLPIALVLFAVVAVVGVLLVIPRLDLFASCSDKESAEFPHLETVASETMPGSVHLTRTSACEEWGRPYAGASVAMRTWRTNSEAISYLQARGWRPSNHDAVSPDGTVSASTVKRERDNRILYVDVTFTWVRDAEATRSSD